MSTSTIHLPSRCRSRSTHIGTRVSVVLSILLSIGCSSHRAPNAQPELARSTLIDVLETWKRNGSIGELRVRNPEIVVQDSAWSNGYQLQSYEVLDRGREEDANVFYEVELTLVEAIGASPRQKTVIYAVGTEPVLTVFRAIL